MKFREVGLSKKDKRFLDKAVAVSRVSTYERFRHGAVIVKNGNVVAVGVNSQINDWYHLSPEDAVTNTTVHAEVAALRACRRVNLNGGVIYVARTNSRGERRMSKPCASCQEAIEEAGIKKVVYTLSHTGCSD